jgi:hypothetical protein
MRDRWTAWTSFPQLSQGGIEASDGPGVYEVCNAATRERLAFGCTRNVEAALGDILEPSGLRKWLSFRRGPRYTPGEAEFRVWPTASFNEAKAVVSLIRDRRGAMLRRFSAVRA